MTDSTQNFDEKFLLAVLERCRELTAGSEDSDWSCMDVPDIVAMLDCSITCLRESSPVDVTELRFLFVVTGPLQETSMSNDWAQEFLLLAERFDQIIGEPS